MLSRAFFSPADALGNASSVHGAGRRARNRLEAARSEVAALLGRDAREVVFTASGSEATALALKGSFLAREDRARVRLIASSIEHPATLFALEQLKSQGAEVVLVPPRPNGAVDLEQLEAELTDKTFGVSLMWANNETGVLQPVASVAELCRRRGVVFHTDAVQAAGRVSVSLKEVPAHLLSLSGHKLGAPAGVGVLVAARDIPLQALVPGHQEGGRRGGTSAVVFAEAFALALGLSMKAQPKLDGTVGPLRDLFEQRLLEALPKAQVNGGGVRLPNTSNVCFPGADGEALLIGLDLEEIYVSSGAACASGSVKPSHVLTAMGLNPAQAQSSLRFSLGARSSRAEVDRVVEALVRLVPSAQGGSRGGASAVL